VGLAYNSNVVAQGSNLIQSIGVSGVPTGFVVGNLVGGGLALANRSLTSASVTAAPGNYTIVANATDNPGATTTVNCPLQIFAALSVQCPTQAIVADRNFALPSTPLVIVTQGVPSYTYSVSGLPAGLTNAGGSVSGLASVNGTFTYTVNVTDALGAFVSRQCPLTVNNQPVPSCPALGTTEVTAPYSQVLAVQFGTAPNTVQVIGTLPPGLNFSNGIISGQATTVGSYTFTVRATDALGATAQVSCTIIVLSGPTATCPEQTAANQNTPFSSDATVVNGTGPYTFTFPGQQVPGLAYQSNGLVVGTPTATGIYFYSVCVQDSVGATDCDNTCQITVNGPLTLECPTATQANANTPFSAAAVVGGGTTPYTFSLTGGAPLTINQNTGVLSGTFTSAGVVPYTLTVFDAAGGMATASCSVTVSGGLSLQCPASPITVNVGGSVASSLTQVGGTGPFTYNSTKPSWLTISGTTISGTAPLTAGPFSYSVTVTDSLSSTSTASCTGTVNAAPQLQCPAAQRVNVNNVYSSAFTVQGGSAPFSSYTITGGALPAGLTLNTSTGVVSGTATTQGTATFSASVRDSTGATATVSNCQIIVSAPLTASCVPQGGVIEGGTFFNGTVVRGGGSGGLSFTVSSGVLPPGLSLNAAGGFISGNVSRSASSSPYNYNVTVTDASGASVTVACTLTITPPPNVLCPSLVSVTLATLYSSFATVTTLPGVDFSPYVYSISSGSLPVGFTLNTTTGEIKGSTAVVGTSTFTVSVTDRNGVVSSSVACGITAVVPGCLSQAAPSTALTNASSLCVGCPSCERTKNPCFNDQCTLRAVLILDNSASMIPYVDQVRPAIMAFVNGLQNIVNVGGSASLGLLYFDDLAYLAFPSQNPLMTPITPSYVSQVQTFVYNTYLVRMGNTNWAAGLNLATSTNWGTQVDIFVMYTDGNPGSVNNGLTWVCAGQLNAGGPCYDYTQGVGQSFFSDLCNPNVNVGVNQSGLACLAASNPTAFPLYAGPGLHFEEGILNDQTNGLYAACYAADQLKKTGAKLFLVGVGDVMYNEDEIQVITGRLRWDGSADSFFTSDYIISQDFSELVSLFQKVALGLCPCLASAPTCQNTILPGGVSSCTAQLFSALAVVTTQNTVSATFAPFSQTTANLYYHYTGGTGTAVGWEFYDPTVSANFTNPAIVRTDIINTCAVQRYVTCQGTCYAVQEQQILPRFFVEVQDTLGTSGSVYGGTTLFAGCTGYTKNYPTPLFAANLLSNKEVIHYVWVQPNGQPCGAEAYDGTLYQFFNRQTPPRVGVFDFGSQPLQLPADVPSNPFEFTKPVQCSARACQQAAEIVFVIDGQVSVTNGDFAAMKTLVQRITVNMALVGQIPTTAFGVAWSNPSDTFQGTPGGFSPLTLTSTTLTNSGTSTLFYDQFVLTHPQSAGTTDFASRVTAAVQQFWGNRPVTLPRYLVTLVGGPDNGQGSFTNMQNVLTANKVTTWAYGLNRGAQNATLLGLLATPTPYVHYKSYSSATFMLQDSTTIVALLCPAGNLCGAQCGGFCTCATAASCACPSNCTNNACVGATCPAANQGCVPVPTVCDDRNSCPNDFCDVVGGCYHTSALNCTSSNPCVIAKCDGTQATPQCTYTPVQCSTGDPCLVGACNQTNGACVYTPQPTSFCDDNNTCTDDSCQPGFGCRNVPNNNTCPSDACNAVVCNGTLPFGSRCSTTPVNCDDNNACTVDGCDVARGGCWHSLIDCNNGTACLAFSCDRVTGCQATPIHGCQNCGFYPCGSQPGDPVLASCTLFNCIENVADCPANQLAQCATGINGPLGRYCQIQNVSCDDGNNCTVDTCSGINTCTSVQVNCSTGLTCQTGACNPATGLCVNTTLNCDDNNACTVDSCLEPGGCNYTTVVCNDNNNCTLDSCDSQRGCVYSPVSCQASTPCITYSCNASTGNCDSTTVVCDDNNWCTTDSCDSIVGCVYTPVVCTGPSKCNLYTCVGGNGRGGPQCNATGTVVCDDLDSCTNDFCLAASGCVYQNITCPEGATPCLYASSCTGTGGSAVCQYTNITALFDFCGVCLGDSTQCFLSSLIGAGAIAGITAGAVAGIVVACVIVALIAAWLGRKGYLYYKSLSDFSAASTTNNPYYTQGDNAGEMIGDEHR